MTAVVPDPAGQNYSFVYFGSVEFNSARAWLARRRKAGDFAAPSSWDAVDVQALKPAIQTILGLAYDGRYLYLATGSPLRHGRHVRQAPHAAVIP